MPFVASIKKKSFNVPFITPILPQPIPSQSSIHRILHHFASHSTRNDPSIQSLSQLDELNTRRHVEAVKTHNNKFKDCVKEMQKLMEANNESYAKAVVNTSQIKTKAELWHHVRSGGVNASELDSVDDIKQQFHKSCVEKEENKEVEVPCKMKVDLDEKVPVEELVNYSGVTVSGGGCHSNCCGCSGHQKTFWRCYSCSYDWNIHGSGHSRCNKCTVSNASYFNNSSYQVIKTLHCNGNGQIGTFWRCYSCSNDWNYYQPGAFYCISCCVNNNSPSYYQNPSYQLTKYLSPCIKCGGHNHCGSVPYSGTVKHSFLAHFKTSKEVEGKAKFKCPNEHHACNCQKTAVLVYCFLANLTENESLRKENERNAQTLKKINDYIKDVDQNLQETSHEIDKVTEKVDQTMSVVQKQTVVLQNNNTMFKENMPMFLKFKEIMDEHEREIIGKQIDGYSNALQEKDREIAGLKENVIKIEEKHR